MEIKHLKSATRLLNKDCVNRGSLDLFKVVMWVSVGQFAAELPKAGVKRKSSIYSLKNVEYSSNVLIITAKFKTSLKCDMPGEMTFLS